MKSQATNMVTGKVTGASSLQTEKRALTEQVHDLIGRGKFADAVRLVDKERRKKSSNFSENFLCRLKAEAYFEKKDYTNALKNIDRSIEVNGTDHYRLFRVSVLVNMNRHQEIIDSYGHLFETQPQSVALHHAFCVAHHRLGDQTEAHRYGRALLQLRDASARSTFRPVDAVQMPDGGRNIVSISLWGNDPIYTLGAIINCVLIRLFLPGWSARFYVDGSVKKACLTQITKQGGEIVRADRLHPDVPPMFWRFLVADDAEVDRFLCRDADSRLTVREASAISAWCASAMPFHVIRDHVLHCDPMLGGLWGGVTAANLAVAERIDAYTSNDSLWNSYGNDQNFLKEMVWPDIRDVTLAHDEFYELAGTRRIARHFKWTEDTHIGRCFRDKKQVAADAKSLGITLR
jgi:tetratricopeptide (TPR) repeat protein